MTGRLLDYDPKTGITESFHYDHTTGKCHIETEQDVEDILDFNKALANLDDKGWSKERDMRRVAGIPNIIIQKWLNEDGFFVFNKHHWEAVARKLDDPDWKWLRTAPGHIGRRTTRGITVPTTTRDGREAWTVPSTAAPR